ncbi:hypothetical protein ACFVZD_47790 [Streptomyces sp. NPDC058287]|uniref:hypothetical protein n=1 Tax=unclassified Streptomyces TaxID=2593676 RepID=UPI0036EB109D
MPAGEDPQRWRILARDLVTYPENVTLATLLASHAWPSVSLLTVVATSPTG